ncbi:MAG: class I lanthipeptide [Hyphomicrobiales bacterium]
MMKKKLELKKETISKLDGRETGRLRGGMALPYIGLANNSRRCRSLDDCRLTANGKDTFICPLTLHDCQ